MCIHKHFQFVILLQLLQIITGLITNTTNNPNTCGWLTYAIIPPYSYAYPQPQTNTTYTNPKTKQTLTLGLLGLYTTLESVTREIGTVGMVNFAAMRINNDPSILPDVQLEVYAADINDSEANTTAAALYLINEYKTKALIGASTEHLTLSMATVADIYGLVTVSPTVSSPDLENKFPHLFRLAISEQNQIELMLTLIKSFGWHQVLIIYTSDEYGLSGQKAFFKAAARASKDGYELSVFSVSIPADVTDPEEMADELHICSSIANNNRLRVRIFYTSLTSGLVFWKLLADAGQTGPDYAYLLSNSFVVFMGKPALIDEYPFIIGSIISYQKMSTDDTLVQNINAWQQAGRSLYPGPNAPFGLWYYYDAIYIIAYAVNQLMRSGIEFEDITSQHIIHQIISQVAPHPNYGPIEWDADYSRQGSLVVQNILPGIDYNSPSVAQYSTKNQNFSFYHQFVFDAAGSTRIPSDGICHCIYGSCDFSGNCICNDKYTGVDCSIFIEPPEPFTKRFIVLVVILPVAVIVAIIGAVIIYKKYKVKQEENIYITGVEIQERIGGGAFGDVYKGLWQGSQVALKCVKDENAIQSLHAEATMLKKLRHPHVLQFFGLFKDITVEYMVTEFLYGGSLEQYLHKSLNKIKLKDILSVAMGAASGLMLLEESNIIHGDIAARNLLLEYKNDKLSVKVADFGLSVNTKENVASSDSKLPIRWAAPELIQYGPEMQSTKSDVWAFGITLWEMFHYCAEEPYSSLKNAEILNFLLNGHRLFIPSHLPVSLINLMNECWQLEPEERPTFKEIFMRLSQIYNHFAAPPGTTGSHPGAPSKGKSSRSIRLASLQVDYWTLTPPPTNAKKLREASRHRLELEVSNNKLFSENSSAYITVNNTNINSNSNNNSSLAKVPENPEGVYE